MTSAFPRKTKTSGSQEVIQSLPSSYLEEAAASVHVAAGLVPRRRAAGHADFLSLLRLGGCLRLQGPELCWSKTHFSCGATRGNSFSGRSQPHGGAFIPTPPLSLPALCTAPLPSLPLTPSPPHSFCLPAPLSSYYLSHILSPCPHTRIELILHLGAPRLQLPSQQTFGPVACGRTLHHARIDATQLNRLVFVFILVLPFGMFFSLRMTRPSTLFPPSLCSQAETIRPAPPFLAEVPSPHEPLRRSVRSTITRWKNE